MKTIDAVKLDQRRADVIEALYIRSGRTNGLYCGLWQDYCLELGAKLRDHGFMQGLCHE